MALSTLTKEVINSTFPFLDLSPELRRNIYIEYFRSQPIRVNFHWTLDDGEGADYVKHECSTAHPSSNLLGTSRLIYKESEPLLFRYTVFDFGSLGYFHDPDNFLHYEGEAHLCLPKRICKKVQLAQIVDNIDDDGETDLISPRLGPIHGLQPLHWTVVMHGGALPTRKLGKYDEYEMEPCDMMQKEHPYKLSFDYAFNKYGPNKIGSQHLPLMFMFGGIKRMLRLLVTWERKILVVERHVDCTDAELRWAVLRYVGLRMKDVTVARDMVVLGSKPAPVHDE